MNDSFNYMYLILTRILRYSLIISSNFHTVQFYNKIITSADNNG